MPDKDLSLTEAAKRKEQDKILVESVFKRLLESEQPKPKDLTVDASVKGNVTEIAINNKKFKVVTDSFIESITRQMQSLVDKSQKDTIMVESRIKGLEKYIMKSNIIVERLEKSNSTLQAQNSQLEKQMNRLLKEVRQARILNE